MYKIKRFLPWIIAAILVVAVVVAYSVMFLERREVETVRIGYTGAVYITSLPDLVARETYLPEYGVVGEPSFFEGDALNLKALIGGTVDISGNVGGVSILAAIEAGVNLKVFACPGWRVEYQLVSKDTIQSLKDLEGKNIGIVAPGGDSHVFTSIVLEREGVDVESVNWVQVGTAGARAKALLAGKIDASVLVTEFALEVLKAGGFHILASVPQLVPSYMFLSYVATEDYIEEHPDVILALTKAIIRATRWAQDDAAFVEKAQETFPEMSPETISDAHTILLENDFWSTNGGLTKEVADFTNEVAIRVGAAKEKRPMESWITTEFVEKALKELGTYESSAASIFYNSIHLNLQATPIDRFSLKL